MGGLSGSNAGNIPGSSLLTKIDERDQPPWYAWDGGDAVPLQDDFLWTRSTYGWGSFQGNLDNMRPVFDFDSLVNVPRSSMGVRNMSISGITRNAAGQILPGCVVKMYQTGSDIVLGETVSDPVLATFNVTTMIDNATVYLVAYLPGSPDVAGTTIDTLVVS